MCAVKSAAQLLEGFPWREGGGLVSNTYFNFQNEMGASFLCPLGLFFVGKNMEAQHEYVVYMLVSNHLILIVWFLFLLGIGKGVCSKDLKMLHTLVYQKWLIGLKPWAENCSAMVSVLEVIGMPCRTCWAAITVVLVLVLDFVILAGVEQLLVSEDGGELCSQELQQHGHHWKGWARSPHKEFFQLLWTCRFFFFLWNHSFSSW